MLTILYQEGYRDARFHPWVELRKWETEDARVADYVLQYGLNGDITYDHDGYVKSHKVIESGRLLLDTNMADSDAIRLAIATYDRLATNPEARLE